MQAVSCKYISLHYKLSCPSKLLVTLFWQLCFNTMNKGTPLDLHEPKKDPQMDHASLIHRNLFYVFLYFT